MSPTPAINRAVQVSRFNPVNGQTEGPRAAVITDVRLAADQHTPLADVFVFPCADKSSWPVEETTNLRVLDPEEPVPPALTETGSARPVYYCRWPAHVAREGYSAQAAEQRHQMHTAIDSIRNDVASLRTGVEHLTDCVRGDFVKLEQRVEAIAGGLTPAATIAAVAGTAAGTTAGVNHAPAPGAHPALNGRAEELPKREMSPEELQEKADAQGDSTGTGGEQPGAIEHKGEG